MAETANFAAPILTDAGVSSMRLASLTIALFPDPIVKVVLQQWNGSAFVVSGKSFSIVYRGAEATALLNQLNTTNFSTVSLRQRVMERLITDNKLTNCTLV